MQERFFYVIFRRFQLFEPLQCEHEVNVCYGIRVATYIYYTLTTPQINISSLIKQSINEFELAPPWSQYTVLRIEPSYVHLPNKYPR